MSEQAGDGLKTSSLTSPNIDPMGGKGSRPVATKYTTMPTLQTSRRVENSGFVSPVTVSGYSSRKKKECNISDRHLSERRIHVTDT